MSLTEARFHDLVDATQEKLEDIFDDSGLDVDLESSAGVLTVKFESGQQLIFSRQEPLRQLWLAARSEYTDHPPACLCAAPPVRRGFAETVGKQATMPGDISYRHP